MVREGEFFAGTGEVHAIATMPVPAGVVHGYYAGTGFDEAAGDAEVAHHFRGAIALVFGDVDAVAIDDLGVFFGEVEGFGEAGFGRIPRACWE